MSLEAIKDFLQKRVFTIPSMDRGNRPSFNPYNDTNPQVGLPGADQIRRKNLYNYLQSFSSPPGVLVVGEAPGWRGCRFSGVPFTSEAQLFSGELPFRGQPSSQRFPPYRESTATTFWRVMRPYYFKFLTWNCIPFHLHRPGEALANRTPTMAEIDRWLPLLEGLVALLAPQQVIAVGRNAERALARLGVTPLVVRHPAHGGAKAFQAGMEATMNPRAETQTQQAGGQV